jgi:hypothetical protein
MRGELPKVGDTIPALLPSANLIAKVVVASPSPDDELGQVAVKIQADEV